MQPLFHSKLNTLFIMYTAEQILQLVNDGLAAMKYERKPEGLYAPIKYVLSLGGKRIRPVLMLMAYNLYKERPADILTPALAIETYHNYTLLHDDLMDRAEMRRGKPTVHKVWDENTAILSGDSMLVLAYHLMAQCTPDKLKPVLELFTETALEIGEGQQYDMEFETRDDVQESEYIEMIRLKTSVLLACALRIGAILADAPEDDARLLYAFGEKIGLAFQLQDDWLDVYGDPAVFGKKIGGDILCNKKTYMLINALQRADEHRHAELVAWLKRTDARPEEKIAGVTELYNQIGIKELCDEKINSYFREAHECLGRVNLPEARKQALWDFAQALLHRNS